MTDLHVKTRLNVLRHWTTRRRGRPDMLLTRLRHIDPNQQTLT
jgi:hypothetical protein